MKLQDYHASASDWRSTLRKNQQKTQAVIALFLTIYTSVGFFADTLILQTIHPHLTLQQAWMLLLTLQALPYATLIMSGIAILSLSITYAFYDKIMLMGTEYQEVTPASYTTYIPQQNHE